MRFVIISILLFLAFSAQAEEVTCFNGGHKIYHSKGKNVAYVDSILTFEEPNSGRVIFISADCVVKMDNLPNPHKRKLK